MELRVGKEDWEEEGVTAYNVVYVRETFCNPDSPSKLFVCFKIRCEAKANVSYYSYSTTDDG